MINIKTIVPKTTAIICIDMQEEFLTPSSPLYCTNGVSMIPSLSKFQKKCRESGLMVMHAKTVWREDGKDSYTLRNYCPPVIKKDGLVGGEIVDAIAPQDDEIVIVKNNYSAFIDTRLDTILREFNIKTVAIAGVCTDCCCFSTARDASAKGYDVAFLSDLTATLDYDIKDNGFGSFTADEVQQVYLATIATTTAHVMSSEEFLSKITV